VDLEDLRLAGVYPELRQDRHKARRECLELLPRLPDLADPDVPVQEKAIGREICAARWRECPGDDFDDVLALGRGVARPVGRPSAAERTRVRTWAWRRYGAVG
jgi:hypothetical protein